MTRTRMSASLALAFVILAVPLGAKEPTPEETVREYLGALQDQNFGKSYDLVSNGMKKDRKTGQVKTKEAYIKESQYIAQFSEAKIFDYKVFPGKIEGEKAFVPNILSSQDKFLNQLGADEYELYTLIKEDGMWKIDQQELVVDSAGMQKWFPKQAGEKKADPGVAPDKAASQ